MAQQPPPVTHNDDDDEEEKDEHKEEPSNDSSASSPQRQQQQRGRPKQTPPTGDPTCCQGCGQTFPSRNAVFRHLKETNGACLLESSEKDSREKEYQEFVKHVRRTEKLQKVLILYGYLPFSSTKTTAEKVSKNDSGSSLAIHNGQDAGRILMETIQELQDDLDGVTSTKPKSDTTDDNDNQVADSTKAPSPFDRLNRSYGNLSRAADCIHQDPDTAAISEVMAVRLRPLRMGMTEDEWLDQVQERLDRKYRLLLQQNQQIEKTNDPEPEGITTPVRILGRLELPNAKFNAETDVTQRRMEYVLPVDFLTWSMEIGCEESHADNADNSCTLPAVVSSSVHPSRSATASSKNGKAVEGWDPPPSVAIPTSDNKAGWKAPHQLQWRTPQRIASLSPIAASAMSTTATTENTSESSPSSEDGNASATAAAFDEKNGAGRLYCAPLIVSKGRYVLVASGTTLFLYQVTSSLREPLESLPQPVRSILPMTQLMLLADDSTSRSGIGVESRRDTESPKWVGDIQQMIFHEESSLLYVLTADCAVFQVKLKVPSSGTISSIDASARDEPGSVAQEMPADVATTDDSEVPTLLVWRKFQTTEFGATCMTTLHNGGGQGSDALCVGCSSGRIESWFITRQQPEMGKSRPQRREKPAVLRWKGYLERPVRTLAFMRRAEEREQEAQEGHTEPPTKEVSSPGTDSAPVGDFAVSEYYLIAAMHIDSGSTEHDEEHPTSSMVEVLDAKQIYDQRVDSPRKEGIPLQRFTVPLSPGMGLIDSCTMPPTDENLPNRSPILGVDGADAATVLSTSRPKNGADNPGLCITLPDGTVALFSCIRDAQLGRVGINRDFHQILLPYPAIGSGALRLDSSFGLTKGTVVACCLRGGTCYLVPTDEGACRGGVTAIPYPNDISFDRNEIYVQSFAAGNLQLGNEENLTPVLIYAWPGGMVDVFTCTLANTKSNFQDASASRPRQTLGQRVRADLPVFSENHKHDLNHVDEAAPLPAEDLRLYMTELKNIMKLLRTHIVAVNSDEEASMWEKRNNVHKRKQQKSKRRSKQPASLTNVDDITNESDSRQQKHQNGEDQPSATSSNSASRDFAGAASEPTTSKDFEKQQNYLKRKRFHNFTKEVMAHQYLAYRRLDRLYHRATLELPSRTEAEPSNKIALKSQSKYAIISISGDMFLTEQAQRVIGVFLALANGVVGTEFVECVFDESYPHLVPTPTAPLIGLISAEAHYMNTEGKIKSVLSPRVSHQYESGFNRNSTLIRVKKWQEVVYNHISKVWERDGRESVGGRLCAERRWTEVELLPWAERARIHLNEYRLWKKSGAKASRAEKNNEDDNLEHDTKTSLIPSFDTIDPMVPEAFEEVLRCLREVDASGDWPSTTPKRQLVMVSTQDGDDDNGQQADSLAIALSKAKRNMTIRSSAYSFTEGQGGASGSFSVGYMPGTNKQPKANSMFPKLVKAAFDLETVLCPDREPSSTIAINRNAQFRPHTDSGAGAGQSTSLIVGLGTYSGGELMVEGTKHDIRYKAIEFNGWKQRHWTMPFKGERYSLVWFTPKGCEGMKGIDLDL